MTSRSREDQHGQETLQAILVVALVLLPVLAAIFTFGSLIHTYIAGQAAAAAGARAAGTAGGFGPSQMLRVDEELAANGVSPNSCTVSASAYRVAYGEPITVRVHCPEHVSIPFLPIPPLNLDSSFVSRGEVNQ